MAPFLRAPVGRIGIETCCAALEELAILFLETRREKATKKVAQSVGAGGGKLAGKERRQGRRSSG
jgi:hypothetical protein